MQNAKRIVLSQMDNFESLEDELAPITQILFDDNEKNPSFFIAQSQTQTGPNASFKMTIEVFNDFLDFPMAFQCLGFCKNYEKNANIKIS